MDSTASYLDAPLIDGLVYEISDDRISIRCSHTCFISVTSLGVPLEKEALLEQYKRVLWLAKENSVRVAYTAHIRKEICTSWPEYVTDYQEARQLFARMLKQARVIEKRGIHRGWRNDQELEYLYTLQRQFQRYLYKDSVISRISGVKNYLDDIERYLTQFSDKLSIIFL